MRGRFFALMPLRCGDANPRGRLMLVWVTALLAFSLLAAPAQVSAATIVFQGASQPGIYAIDESGRNKRAIFRGEGFSHPSAAPNGRRLAYCERNKRSRRTGRWFTSNLRGGERKILGISQNCLVARDLSWSPDSRRVTATHSVAGIVIKRFPRGRARWLWHGDVPSRASFSPDGRRLVFSRQFEVETDDGEGDDTWYDLWVLGSDGRGPRALTTTPSTKPVQTVPGDFRSYACLPGAQEEFDPVWGPGGIVASYSRCRPDGTALVGLALFDHSGRHVRDLGPAIDDRSGGAKRTDAAWSPDGRRIVAGLPNRAGVRVSLAIINPSTGQWQSLGVQGFSPSWVRRTH